MAHISSIGAGLFSDLSVAMPLTAPVFATLDSDTEFAALFGTEITANTDTKTSSTFVRVRNARTFPAMGTPANIVKVPAYGAKTSQTIQGQADAPQLEISLNFVASDFAKGVAAAGSLLGNAVGDGNQYVFRFALMNSEPTGVGATKYATTVPGVGTVQNSLYYWYGKLEALLVTPNLTDANTATLTLSIQSPFYGAYTI